MAHHLTQGGSGGRGHPCIADVAVLAELILPSSFSRIQPIQLIIFTPLVAELVDPLLVASLVATNLFAPLVACLAGARKHVTVLHTVLRQRRVVIVMSLAGARGLYPTIDASRVVIWLTPSIPIVTSGTV